MGMVARFEWPEQVPEPPLPADSMPVDVKEWSDNVHVYICPQSLMKFHPVRELQLFSIALANGKD